MNTILVALLVSGFTGYLDAVECPCKLGGLEKGGTEYNGMYGCQNGKCSGDHCTTVTCSSDEFDPVILENCGDPQSTATVSAVCSSLNKTEAMDILEKFAVEPADREKYTGGRLCSCIPNQECEDIDTVEANVKAAEALIEGSNHANGMPSSMWGVTIGLLATMLAFWGH